MQTAQLFGGARLPCRAQAQSQGSFRAPSIRITSSFLSACSLNPLKHSASHLQFSRARISPFSVRAARTTPSEPWWEKNNPPNMKNIASVQELVDAMADAGDNLVIVDFYAQWCAACRALFPKLCQLCEDNPNITLLKIDWDHNKPIAKPLGVKVLPYFMFYRGVDGQLAAFSASVSKVQRLRDAIAVHNTDRCYMEHGTRLEQFADVKPHASAADHHEHPPDVTILEDKEPAAV